MTNQRVWTEQDVLQDPDKAVAEIERLRGALKQVYEIWAGSDGFIPQTAAEAYQERIIHQMRDAVQHGLGAADEPSECPHCRAVYEVWAGSDGMVPETAAEAYQERLIVQMRDAAQGGLAVKSAESLAGCSNWKPKHGVGPYCGNCGFHADEHCRTSRTSEQR